MIKKTTRKIPATQVQARKPIRASQSITAGVRNRQAANRPVMASLSGLTPEQRAFAMQLQSNIRKNAPIMGATNTTNIPAKPEFLELLPLFVQKLLILDVYGSVAMKSRQQLIPYFKFIAENTKGETHAGDIKSSPFVNRQGIDPNWAGRLIKNEEATIASSEIKLAYTPVLPNSVSIVGASATFVDDGKGCIFAKTNLTTVVGYVDYSTGVVHFDSATGDVKSTYEYDNENVGPRAEATTDYGYEYGAQMAKGYLQLDEINMVAEAHELACYWSVYSAFAASKEYGGNVADIAKEAAISELTAEINTKGFLKLAQTASFKPQFNWDASPVLSGSVVPSDYLNMFKLKLNQAAASIYQATRLTQPNKLIVGTNVASYISMINNFKAEGTAENVGPYKLGKLDQFDIFVEPNYNPDTWVRACKSNDIRRNSALFGEYMPITHTDAIGLANASVQQGTCSMYAMKIVNPDTVVSGKILGTF